MNKFRLVNAALFVVIAVMAVLACMSHVNSKNTQGLHASLSEIGHHLIEARDRVVNRYSMEERKRTKLPKVWLSLNLPPRIYVRFSNSQFGLNLRLRKIV